MDASEKNLGAFINQIGMTICIAGKTDKEGDFH